MVPLAGSVRFGGFALFVQSKVAKWGGFFGSLIFPAWSYCSRGRGSLLKLLILSGAGVAAFVDLNKSRFAKLKGTLTSQSVLPPAAILLKW